MKNSLLFILLFAIPYLLLAQDVILTKNGWKFDCKIVKEDSLNVYYQLKGMANKPDSEIKKSDIKKIIYANIQNNIPAHVPSQSQVLTADTPHNTDLKYILTLGLLNGGGSLIGADFEVVFPRYWGIQAGMGISGYGCGLNFHLKKSERSSFLSLQYWHQGIGNQFSQSLIGPQYVYRGNKWFTSQIGLGIIQDRGPAYPFKDNFPPIILTYALGVYFPM